VLDEVYRAGLTQDVLTNEAKRLKDRYNITQFFCDPSEPALIAAMNQSGLASSAARNEVIPGIMEVSSRLKVQDDGRPRLFVYKGAVNTLTEFHQYRYAESKKDILKEEPLKVYDHSMDAIRYALYSLKKTELKISGKLGGWAGW
jgi:phage terminase large subunit